MSRFCGNCGEEVEGGKFCPSCGAPLDCTDEQPQKENNTS